MNKEELNQVLEFVQGVHDGEWEWGHRREPIIAILTKELERVEDEPVAEIIECEIMGQQTVREINGQWKFLKIGDKLYTRPQSCERCKDTTLQEIAANLHYPDCWDTAAYPTLESAIHEAKAWECSVCKPDADLDTDPQADLTSKEILADRLITAWCDSYQKQIPWNKAVEITAIVTNMPPDERARLLALNDDEPTFHQSPPAPNKPEPRMP